MLEGKSGVGGGEGEGEWGIVRLRGLSGEDNGRLCCEWKCWRRCDG